MMKLLIKTTIIISILLIVAIVLLVIFRNEEELYFPNEDYVISEGKMMVHFINMGRNDGIIIQTNDKVIVIDGGSYNEADLIIDYLNALGINNIDVLIGSHIHHNHIQSHARILRGFNVNKLYYPHQLELCYEEMICNPIDIRYTLDEINYQNKTINIMEVGEIIEIGDITIEVLGPILIETFNEHRWPQNFNSLNFILTFGNHRFFFSGDGIQEENLLNKFYDKDLRVDVFKFPHHGEDNLGVEFINRLSARYVVETHHTSQLAGLNQATGNLLLENGASILYFEDNRNIIFTSDGTNLFYERKTLIQLIEMRK